VLIDDRHNLDRSAVGGGVELEVNGPYPVRRIRGQRVGLGRGADAFASAALRHPQTLFAPKPLDLLMIHDPALTPSIVIRRPETTTRMILGILAQPSPQRRIRVLGGI
jgi:hypothetical protein